MKAKTPLPGEAWEKKGILRTTSRRGFLVIVALRSRYIGECTIKYKFDDYPTTIYRDYLNEFYVYAEG